MLNVKQIDAAVKFYSDLYNTQIDNKVAQNRFARILERIIHEEKDEISSISLSVTPNYILRKALKGSKSDLYTFPFENIDLVFEGDKTLLYRNSKFEKVL